MPQRGQFSRSRLPQVLQNLACSRFWLPQNGQSMVIYLRWRAIVRRTFLGHNIARADMDWIQVSVLCTSRWVLHDGENCSWRQRPSRGVPTGRHHIIADLADMGASTVFLKRTCQLSPWAASRSIRALAGPIHASKYPSQIELMQATVELLLPHGPPTAAGQRIGHLVLREANASPRRSGLWSISGWVSARTRVEHVPSCYEFQS